MPRPLRALPKTHLHLHLDGSFPRPAVEALARRRGVDWAPPSTFTSLADFLDHYAQVPALVAELDDLARLCRALVAHEADQGVAYLEPVVDPRRYGHLGGVDAVLGTVVDALGGAASDRGVGVGVMLGIDAGRGAADALAVLAAAVPRAGRGLVSIGTVGAGGSDGLAPFGAVAAAARDAGLLVTCHAGEGGPPGVREALEALAPDRIGHGVDAARDPGLLDELAGRGVVCDVALTSNVALRLFPRVEDHPLPVMLAAGVAVTLNADDELFFGSGVLAEYEVARRVLGLDDARLAAIAATGAAASGATPGVAAALRDGAARWAHG